MSVFARIYPPVMAALNRLGVDGWRVQLGVGVGTGRVLEVGCGPGFQRRFLPAGAAVVGLEPDVVLRGRAVRQGYLDVVDGVAERLPFPDDSFPDIVMSMVLCTVDDPAAAAREAARVLAPGGTLHLFEHVHASNRCLRSMQHVLRIPWARLGGGCNLCQEPLAAVRAAGFTVRVERTGLGGSLLLARAQIR